MRKPEKRQWEIGGQFEKGGKRMSSLWGDRGGEGRDLEVW